jgi:hypothetical protein
MVESWVPGLGEVDPIAGGWSDHVEEDYVGQERHHVSAPRCRCSCCSCRATPPAAALLVVPPPLVVEVRLLLVVGTIRREWRVDGAVCGLGEGEGVGGAVVVGDLEDRLMVDARDGADCSGARGARARCRRRGAGAWRLQQWAGRRRPSLRLPRRRRWAGRPMRRRWWWWGIVPMDGHKRAGVKVVPMDRIYGDWLPWLMVSINFVIAFFRDWWLVLK